MIDCGGLGFDQGNQGSSQSQKFYCSVDKSVPYKTSYVNTYLPVRLYDRATIGTFTYVPYIDVAFSADL